MDDYELLAELDNWVERYVREVSPKPDWVPVLRELAHQEPGLAASELLCAYVVGKWDLTDEELARLWRVGRSCDSAEELVPDDVLRQAAPGRTLPPDPPDPDLVQTPILQGGGHGRGRQQPGKTVFPGAWSDDDVIRQTMDVAKHPSGAVELPDGQFRAWGERQGVLMSVIVSTEGSVRTSYPVSGPGVGRNPLDDRRGPHVQRLQALLDTIPPSEGEPRYSLAELMRAGEWPHVITGLKAMDIWSDQQRAELEELSDLAGIWRTPDSST